VGSADLSVDAVQAVVESGPVGEPARAGAAQVGAKAARDARARLIVDALFAAEAAERFAGTGLVSTARRATLARALLESVAAEVAAAGPPTNQELTEASQGRWVEFDRPAAAQTRHALAVYKEGQDKGVAREVAERLAAAVRGATSPGEFVELAKAVEGGDVEIVVEPLPPVTADGRTFVLDRSGQPARALGNFDLEFSHAANEIENAGGISPIVESRFGFHVIYLERHFPEYRVPLDDMREELAAEVMNTRGKAIVDRVYAEQAERHPVTKARTAPALTAEVDVSAGAGLTGAR